MANNVIVLQSTQTDVDAIKHRLRQIDERECRACGRTGAEALQIGLNSEICMTAFYKHQPVMLFGVNRRSLLFNEGVPWLLGTDDVERIGSQIVRRSHKYIKMFMMAFSYLENYVHVENHVSINWLKWMGFTVEAPEPYGIHGEMFHRFWMRRK